MSADPGSWQKCGCYGDDLCGEHESKERVIKILEKAKGHVRNFPRYSLDSKKFLKADKLTEGRLSEIREWYADLKDILGLRQWE